MARENSTKLVKQPTLQQTLNRMCGSTLVSTSLKCEGQKVTENNMHTVPVLCRI